MTEYTNTEIPPRSNANVVRETRPETRTTTAAEPVHPRGTDTVNESSGGVGHSVKSAVAGIHGAGEALRGGACAAVDRAVDDPQGARKNEAITREGEQEIGTGNFSRLTKEKEGLHHNRKSPGL